MIDKIPVRKSALFVSITAIIMALFHLYTSGFGRFPALQQRSIHLAFALILTFYLYPVRKKGGAGKLSSAMNLLSSLGALLCCGNITFVIYYVLYERAGAATNIDIVLGFILIILVLDIFNIILGYFLTQSQIQLLLELFYFFVDFF